MDDGSHFLTYNDAFEYVLLNTSLKWPGLKEDGND